MCVCVCVCVLVFCCSCCVGGGGGRGEGGEQFRAPRCIFLSLFPDGGVGGGLCVFLLLFLRRRGLLINLVQKNALHSFGPFYFLW